MKMTLLHLGTNGFDANGLVSGTVQATRSNPHPQCYLVDIPVWGALIQIGEGEERRNIIYDLGCRLDGMEEGVWTPWFQDISPFSYEPDQTIEAQLTKVGLTPADIDTVVISHLHNDHFGNIKLFTHADIYVPFEDWVAALAAARDPQDTREVYDHELMNTPFDQVNLVRVDEDFELVPGVDIITLPGHTPNLLGLVVKLPRDGAFILPSDALYTPTNYGPPVALPGVIADSKAYVRSVEKIRALQEELDATILFSHSYPDFNTYRTAPEWYE